MTPQTLLQDEEWKGRPAAGRDPAGAETGQPLADAVGCEGQATTWDTKRTAALWVAPRKPWGSVVRPSQTTAGRLRPHASYRGFLGAAQHQRFRDTTLGPRNGWRGGAGGLDAVLVKDGEERLVVGAEARERITDGGHLAKFRPEPFDIGAGGDDGLLLEPRLATDEEGDEGDGHQDDVTQLVEHEIGHRGSHGGGFGVHV